MADYYADSSVLVKRHIAEVGSAWVRALADPAAGNLITMARISLVEVYSALNRRIREATLDPADYAAIVADFEALCAGEYTLVELTPPIASHARVALERYPLRAYDAVQLASALVANNTLVAAGLATLTFIAADDRLVTAAMAEGLAVDNPNVHP
jgi:predicted nucleic acid-binding protein